MAAQNRIQSLDLIRCYAAVWVAFFHNPYLPEGNLIFTWSRWGTLGVNLFFVLSGFLIADQWFQILQNNSNLSNKTLLKNFYIRRAMRIWPLYYFLLMFYLILPDFFQQSTEPLWMYLTLTHNFSGLKNLHPSWSLCVEEHFYLIFPLISLWVFRSKFKLKGELIFATFLSLQILFRMALWFKYRPDLYATTATVSDSIEYFSAKFYNPTWTRMDGLAIGVMIAAIKNYRTLLWEKLILGANRVLIFSVLLFFSGIIVASNTFRSYLPEYMSAAGSPAARNLLATGFSETFFALAFGGIIMGAFGGFLSRLRIPGINTLALLSYAIYMSHVDVYIQLQKIFPSQGSWGITCFSFVVIIGVSTLLYYYIERPILGIRPELCKK